MKSTERLGGVGREESKVATNNEVEETDPEKVQVAVDGSNEEKGSREDTHTSADDAHDHLVTEFIILQMEARGRKYTRIPQTGRERPLHREEMEPMREQKRSSGMKS